MITLNSDQEILIRSYVKDCVLPKHTLIDEEDAVTVVSILVATELVPESRISTRDPRAVLDLKKETKFECLGGVRSDKTETRRRRITKLCIGSWDSYPFCHPWELTTNKKSQITDLYTRLSDLETLKLERCRWFKLFEALRYLRNLRTLDVSCFTTDGTSIRCHDSNGWVPHLNLENLYISRAAVVNSDEDLAYLFVDVLPRLPNLRVFRVGCMLEQNRMESFRRAAERIRETPWSNDSRCRLRKLVCEPEPDYKTHMQAKKLKKRMNDPAEEEAVATVLTAFRELSVVEGIYGWNLDTGDIHAAHGKTLVPYLFEINHAGRVLVEPRPPSGTDRKNDILPPGVPSTAIPLSVWPRVLERAGKYGKPTPNRTPRAGDGATGVYYLLRKVMAPVILQEWSRSPCGKANQ